MIQPTWCTVYKYKPADANDKTTRTYKHIPVIHRVVLFLLLISKPGILLVHYE